MILRIGEMELEVNSAEEVFSSEMETNKFFSFQIALESDIPFEELMTDIDINGEKPFVLDGETMTGYKFVNATKQFASGNIILYFKKTV